MAGRGLGTLTLNVIANIGGFIQGMNRMQRQAQNTVNDITAYFRNLTAQLAGVGTALKNVALIASSFVVANFAAVTAAITAAAKAGIEAADKFDELSARLSISVETLSSLSYAAEMSGVSLDDLASVLPKLSKFMAESLDPGSKAAKILKELGISAVDANGNLKSSDVMLLELANKFKQFDDATGEAALAMEIFGKSGAQFLEFLNRGGDGIEELQERARSMGLVFSSETAAASAELNDKLSELSTASQVLGATIATDLLPKITEAIDYFQELGKDGKTLETIVTFLGGAIDLAKIAFEGLSIALNAAQANISAIITVVTTAINQVKILGNTVIETAKALASFNPKAALEAQFQGLKDLVSNGVNGAKEIADAQNKYMGGSARSLNSAWHTLNGTMTDGQKQAQKAAEASKAAADAAYRAQNISLMPASSNASPWENQWTKSIQNVQREKQKVDNAAFLDPSGRQVPRSLFDGSDKGAKGKASKEAKKQMSEEEKEAAKLEERYKSMLDQLKERTALIGATTEYAKVLYDTENGELSKLLPAKKEELLTQARLYDERNEQYKKDEEERKKKEREIENLKSIKEELNFQLEILGKTREEQEKIALLRELGSQATTEEGKALVAQLENLQKQQKIVEANVELSDTIRSSFVDSFKGIVDGSMSAKDAVLSFLDKINAKILDMIANQWAEKLFGQFGSAMGGSIGGAGGGGWFQNFMGMFSGGRATGGPVSGNGLYRVNENGPEMLSIAGKDFLMLGRNGGNVTANHKLQGGGFVQNVTFQTEGKIDRRTQQQAAFDLQRAATRATNRNS